MNLGLLSLRHGGAIELGYFSGPIKAYALSANVDAYIVSTEEGFSPLGSNLAFLSEDLGVPEEQLRQLANWNRFNNSRVSLVAIPSRRQNSKLRGVILAACESSEVYKQFSVPFYGRPSRDFYYNVSYEAYAYVARQWGARNIALSHLSSCNRFHPDIATCNAEALAHHGEACPGAINSLTFMGDTAICNEHLSSIALLNKECSTEHRPITVEIERRDGYELIHLEWPKPS